MDEKVEVVWTPGLPAKAVEAGWSVPPGLEVEHNAHFRIVRFRVPAEAYRLDSKAWLWKLKTFKESFVSAYPGFVAGHKKDRSTGVLWNFLMPKRQG